MRDVIHHSTWNKGENQKQMDLAVCEVAEGNMTVRKVAVSYGIPKSLLHDNVKGKVQLGAGIGAQRYLTDDITGSIVKNYSYQGNSIQVKQLYQQ